MSSPIQAPNSPTSSVVSTVTLQTAQSQHSQPGTSQQQRDNQASRQQEGPTKDGVTPMDLDDTAAAQEKKQSVPPKENHQVAAKEASTASEAVNGTAKCHEDSKHANEASAGPLQSHLRPPGLPKLHFVLHPWESVSK